MTKTIVQYMGLHGKMREVECDGLLDALTYITENKIRGAKYKIQGEEWEDADKFLEAAYELFAPLPH